MKNLYLTFLVILISSVNLLKAEIPQSEKDALLAIAASLYYPYNWSEDIPFEEWNGIVISEIDNAEHITGINVGRQINNLTDNINFSNQIQNLTYLNNFQLVISGNSNIEVFFDFQYFINLQHLEDMYLRFPSTANGDKYYLINTDKIAEIDNLKDFTIFFNNPEFTLPDNFSNLNNLRYLNYENVYNYFPNYIYDLPNLEELRVRVKIYENFPNHIDNLSNLSNLKTLIIEGAEFSSIDGSLPQAFYNLPSIENLSLLFYHSSNLQISNDIINYTNQLKFLSLQARYLYNLPPNLWSLNSLERLDLHTTDSSLYLSDQIQNLTNLKILRLSSNDQIFAPPTIKNMTNLESLSLLPLQYSVYPNELYETPNLKIYVSTVFEEIPELITNLPHLEHIQFFSTDGILASFPDFLGNMNNLKKIDLLNTYNGSVNNNNLFTFPDNYFNWPDLEQFWTELKIDSDITNKFLNSPNLEVLAFESSGSQNLRGILNLCNNPKLESLSLYNSNIQKIDFRNNQTFTNGDFRFMRFDNNAITNFYVDDVDIFNNLIDTNKVRITNNSTNYQVTTTSEPCPRAMNVKEITENSVSRIYPNPTKDFIYFEKGKSISDVTVTSVEGKTLETFFSNGKVNVSHLPKGVYLIKYQSDGVYYLDKFIKK